MADKFALQLTFPIAQEEIAEARATILARIAELNAEHSQLTGLLDALRQACMHKKMKDSDCPSCGYAPSVWD